MDVPKFHFTFLFETLTEPVYLHSIQYCQVILFGMLTGRKRTAYF